jgi:phenylacetate-CoA ligase
MKPVRHLSDQERFPTLSEAGKKMLDHLREHPHAPKYNYACGDQLSACSLDRVRSYSIAIKQARNKWEAGEIPDWVLNFADRCLVDVPFYRRIGGRADEFLTLPTISRRDLENAQCYFVPDSQKLDEMLVYYTSGTTGNPFYVLSHPEVSSMYLPAMEFALGRVGVEIEGGANRVFAVNVCAQSSTLTYATVSTYFGGAGYVKINLNPSEWKNIRDAEIFIDDLQPEIFTGDPIAFLALAKLKLQVKPKALVSSALTLMPALKELLESHFDCPVVDVYSTNESRFIAASNDARKFEIVPHDLFVEILDREGNQCAPGECGEITLTCARNPFLPLLRYRTGDFAAIDFDGEYPALTGFEGRRPTVFINTAGNLINNIDVTQALQPFPIGQFSMHQSKDRALTLKLRGEPVNEKEIREVILDLFGENQDLTIRELAEDETTNGKALQYTSELDLLTVEDTGNQGNK